MKISLKNLLLNSIKKNICFNHIKKNIHLNIWNVRIDTIT